MCALLPCIMPTASHAAADPRATLLCQLQQQLQQFEGPRRNKEGQSPISTGCPQLDALLPAGGLQRGTLVECFPSLESESGSGAGTLAMLLTRAVVGQSGVLVAIDRRRRFYPPAAVALGIDWQQLILVRPSHPAEELWALDQALRCGGVRAVWAPVEKLSAHDFRRLQLAAENSGCIGFLLRPARLRKAPSWAHVQLTVTPLPSRPESENRRLEIQLLRVRGRATNQGEQKLKLEIDAQNTALRAVTARALPNFIAQRETG